MSGGQVCQTRARGRKENSNRNPMPQTTNMFKKKIRILSIFRGSGSPVHRPPLLPSSSSAGILPASGTPIYAKIVEE